MKLTMTSSACRAASSLIWLLLLTGVQATGAQVAARQDTVGIVQSKRWGTWSAKNANGRTFMGTWTAVPDSASGAVTGTWTLADAQGKTVINGGWSAAKSPTQWTGAWRAIVAGQSGEYSGTWTTSVDLKPDARIADLFEKAVQAAVSGGWRTGTESGAWSIRSAQRDTTR